MEAANKKVCLDCDSENPCPSGKVCCDKKCQYSVEDVFGTKVCEDKCVGKGTFEAGTCGKDKRNEVCKKEAIEDSYCSNCDLLNPCATGLICCEGKCQYPVTNWNNVEVCENVCTNSMFGSAGSCQKDSRNQVCKNKMKNIVEQSVCNNCDLINSCPKGLICCDGNCQYPVTDWAGAKVCENICVKGNIKGKPGSCDRDPRNNACKKNTPTKSVTDTVTDIHHANVYAPNFETLKFQSFKLWNFKVSKFGA